MRILTGNHGVQHLIMGVCLKNGSNGNVQKCAWEPNECDTIPNTFFRATDNNPRIMGMCNPSKQSIGRCVLEDQCAFHASDCSSEDGETSSSNFRVDDPTCTIQRDTALEWDADNPDFTQFGSCKDTITGDHFCIFNPSDCEESGSEVYVNPSETKAAGIDCNCSEVHVTGCLIGDNAFCAVSAQGCRPDTTAYSPHNQRVNRNVNAFGTDGLDCRLCERINTPALATYIPTKMPTQQPTQFPSGSLKSDSSMDEFIERNSSMGGRNTAAWNAGGVALVVFLAVFL